MYTKKVRPMITGIIIALLGVTICSFAADPVQTANPTFQATDEVNIDQLINSVKDSSATELDPGELDVDKIIKNAEETSGTTFNTNETTKPGETPDVTASSTLQESLNHIEIDPSNENGYRNAAAFMAKDNLKGIKVFVNGKMIDFSKYDNVEPIIDSGRTLLPLRAVAEAIGANVTWQDSTKAIGLSFGNINMELKIDSTVARVNGNTSTLEVPPKIVNGRTLLPLRFIGEGFNKKVGWLPYSADLKIVYIN